MILRTNHFKLVTSPVFSLSSGMTVTSKLAMAATTKPITTTFFRPNLRKKNKTITLGYEKVLEQISPTIIGKRPNHFSVFWTKRKHHLLNNQADQEIGSDDFVLYQSLVFLRGVFIHIWHLSLLVLSPYCKVCIFFNPHPSLLIDV